MQAHQYVLIDKTPLRYTFLYFFRKNDALERYACIGAPWFSKHIDWHKIVKLKNNYHTVVHIKIWLHQCTYIY